MKHNKGERNICEAESASPIVLSFSWPGVPGLRPGFVASAKAGATALLRPWRDDAFSIALVGDEASHNRERKRNKQSHAPLLRRPDCGRHIALHGHVFRLSK